MRHFIWINSKTNIEDIIERMKHIQLYENWQEDEDNIETFPDRPYKRDLEFNGHYIIGPMENKIKADKLADKIFNFLWKAYLKDETPGVHTLGHSELARQEWKKIAGGMFDQELDEIGYTIRDWDDDHDEWGKHPTGEPVMNYGGKYAQ